MRWTRQYRDSETDYLPEMERLIAFLPETLPEQARTRSSTATIGSTMPCSTATAG